MTGRELPMAHLSIRVPWHDSGWAGNVCDRPLDNSACLALRRIGQQRDDAFETAVAGHRMDELARTRAFLRVSPSTLPSWHRSSSPER